MIDIELLRQSPEKVKEGIEKKGVDPAVVDEFLALDGTWRALRSEVDGLRAEQRKASDARDREKGTALKEKVKAKEEELRVAEGDRDGVLDRIPNLPFDDAPAGKDESHNKVLREVGEKRQFDFPPKDHLSLGTALHLIDTEKAGGVAGNRFSYLLRDAVLLEFALIQFAYEKLIPEGFIPVIPPVMIRPEVYRGMGRLAGDQRDERYYLPQDDLYLIGSAEHTLGPFHMDEVLKKEDLPRRYLGFSTCFRRESGSYGKDVRGILRMHQFDKVEMFSFAAPDESESEHKALLGFQEGLMGELGLPYRVVEICTGDMGWTDARQYDIETWLPGQDKYRETHSCSNTTDFQSRGVNVKYRRADGRAEYVHMLNATALAMSRTPIAILENYQTKDGKIEVPEALRRYMGKDVIG